MRKFGRGGTSQLSKTQMANIIVQHIDKELGPILEREGLTDEMDRIRLYAMDDIFGLMKKGASLLWDHKNALFPTLGPILDQAVTQGKSVIA